VDLNDRIAAAKDLIAKRDEIDAQLDALLSGAVERKTKICSKCGQAGHTARTCTVEPINKEGQP
jgi:hypothetical protein